MDHPQEQDPAEFRSFFEPEIDDVGEASGDIIENIDENELETSDDAEWWLPDEGDDWVPAEDEPWFEPDDEDV